MRQKARNVAQVHTPEAAHRSIRLEAGTQRALRAVEVQLLDDLAAQHDHHFRARRVAQVLLTEVGIAHGLRQRDQHRHILRTAAAHDAVDSNVPHGRLTVLGLEDAEHLVGLAGREPEELLDLFDRGRNDGHALAPLVVEEVFVDLFERTRIDDIAHIGLARGLAVLWLHCQALNDLIGHDVIGVFKHLFIRRHVNVARMLCERQVREAFTGSGELARRIEAVAAKGNCGNSQFLNQDTAPRHGGDT